MPTFLRVRTLTPCEISIANGSRIRWNWSSYPGDRRSAMKIWSSLARVSAFGLMLGGCAMVDFWHTPPGYFTGSVFVMWVAEGNNAGDGIFLFVPDPRDPLIFHRPDPNSHGAKIQPGLMYTDGGSIPKIAQVFNGLSPWGYAPAYMIHDWLFVGRHCLVDGEAGHRFDEIRDVNFQTRRRFLRRRFRPWSRPTKLSAMTSPEKRLQAPSIASSQKTCGIRRAYAHRASSAPRTGPRQTRQYLVRRRLCAAEITTLKPSDCLRTHLTSLRPCRPKL